VRATNLKFGGPAPVTAGNASNRQVYDGKHAEATMTPPELTFQYRGTPITRTFFSRIGIF